NFSAHLHPYGQETPVNAAIAFKFYPKGYVPTHIALTEMMGDDAELDLPPNTDNVRTDTYRTFMKPTRLLSFQPHMHTRGKAMPGLPITRCRMKSSKRPSPIVKCRNRPMRKREEKICRRVETYPCNEPTISFVAVKV